MKCTSCNKEQKQLHGERWDSVLGYIINKNELLCDECAEKRKGFLHPGDLLRKKQKQYSKELG